MRLPDEQTDGYAMLADVSARAARLSLAVFATTDRATGTLAGSIDFIADMAHYVSAGTASRLTEAASIRLPSTTPSVAWASAKA